MCVRTSESKQIPREVLDDRRRRHLHHRPRSTQVTISALEKPSSIDDRGHTDCHHAYHSHRNVIILAFHSHIQRNSQQQIVMLTQTAKLSAKTYLI